MKTIKLTAWISLIFAAITYFISIKGIWGVSDIDWLPDTFLLAVFGGAFASMLVVLICEISNYIQNRESTETYLFSHLYYLYGQLYVILKNIDFFTTHNDQIHKNALSQLISNSEAEMNTVFYTDYAPYKKKSSMLTVKTAYNNKVFPVVQSFLQNCRMYDIAVIEDEIARNEKELGKESGPGNKAYLVLEKLLKQIQGPMSMIDELLTNIDSHHDGRYNWPQMRNNMINNVPDTRTDMLELFLQANNNE